MSAQAATDLAREILSLPPAITDRYPSRPTDPLLMRAWIDGVRAVLLDEAQRLAAVGVAQATGGRLDQAVETKDAAEYYVQLARRLYDLRLPA